MTHPDSWEDPPEDPPEEGDEPKLTRVPCEGVGDNDGFFEFEDRDCDYWEKLK